MVPVTLFPTWVEEGLFKVFNTLITNMNIKISNVEAIKSNQHTKVLLIRKAKSY